VDGLYFGGINSTQSKSCLSEFEITHVLSMCYETIAQFEGVVYKKFEVTDDPSEIIKRYFSETTKYIHETISDGKTILVHCNRGVSRSASVVIAFVMWKFTWKFEKAFDYVRQKRDVIYPNNGFVKQLEEYEKDLDIC